MPKLVLAAVLALSVSWCAPQPPSPPTPPPPALYTLVVGVYDGPVDLDEKIVGATVFVGDQIHVTDSAGNTWFEALPAGTYPVRVEAEGYDPIEVEAVLPRQDPLAVSMAAHGPPVPPSAGESGPIHPDGEVFRRADGSIYQWRGETQFLLFRDFLDGRDLSDRLNAIVNRNANLVRVLGMAHYIPLNAGQVGFNPAQYGDRYFTGLGEFADLLSRYGLRVEFTALADAQILMPIERDQRAFLEKVAGVLTSKPHAFLETGNEPFKNGFDPKRLGRVPGVVQASGVYDYNDAGTPYASLYALDYVTVHPPRDNEWPRKTRLDEYSNALDRPVVWDEPMGAAEVNDPGRRSNVVSDFAEMCAGTALHGAGATFHSEAGLTAAPFGPRQWEAAQACFAAMRAVPPEAPLWQYTAGHLSSCPFAHDEARFLRVFCQLDGNRGVCGFVRLTGSLPSPRDGWTITGTSGPVVTVAR